jgi:tRNA A-37 threonylcarbamoyl transferase component Bud32/tetratricopeptide (TPR) repeat protein
MTESQTLASRYQLLNALGAGGMGEVHLARDVRLERRVAIKLLPRELEADPTARERLRREAIAAASLDHPFICKVHEIGDADGRMFIVMEYVEGETLHAAMRADLLPIRRVLEIANELTQALEEAHRRRVVHRDLKPANVMVTPQGHVKVMDFGLAKNTTAAPQGSGSDAHTVLTGAGVRLGTPAYMSPEQVLGSALDARSDIFSLGVILHELTTGRHPFLRADPSETMAAILRDQPTAGARDEESVPGLRAVLHRMLAKACAERYQSAAELRTDLEGLRDRVWASGSSSQGSGRVAPAAAAERTPFVGRDNETAELKRLLDRMLTGQGGIALVGGEPGVGKTRLARELMREAQQRGCLCLTGHCYEMEGAPPYVPFIEMTEQGVRLVPQAARASMGDLAGDLAVIVPSLRRLYGDIPPPADVPAEQQRRLVFNAYLEFVQRVSAKSPGVVLFDDLHWADEPTLQLLQHVAPHLASMRLLFVGTYRDVELDVKRPFAKALESLLRQRLATRIALRRLTQSGVEQMISAMSHSAPPSGLSAAIFRETEGNPFFVEEVYQHLVEEGKLFDEAGAWRANLRVDSLDVPEGVRLVIGRRLDRLGDDARKVLTAGAVIGRSFPLDVLEVVVDASEDAVLDAIEEAERAQLVAPQPAGREVRYEFVHELIRTTLVSGLSLPRRQRLHLKTADALERLRASSLDSHASVLAHHLYQAGAAANRDRTARFMSVAARRALDAAAFEEALEILENLIGLELDESDPILAEVNELRGAALQALRKPELAVASFERAFATYAARHDDGGIVRAARGASTCLLWQGDFKATDVLRRGLAAVGPSAIEQHILLRSWLAALQVSPSTVVEGVANMAEALRAAETFGDPYVLTRALAARTFHGRMVGDFQASLDAGRRIVSRAADLPLWERVEFLWTFAITEYYTGRLDEAEALLPDLEAAAARAGHRGALWAHERMRHGAECLRSGNIHTYRGQSEAALLDQFTPLQFIMRAQVAACAAYLGDLPAAREHLAIAAAEEPPDQGHSGIPAAFSMGVAALHGRGDEALALLHDVSPWLPKPGQPNVAGAWHALESVIPALMWIDARDRCAALYPLALELVATGLVSDNICFGPTNSQLAAGISAWAAGRIDEAREHFGTAARQARKIPFRILQPTVDYWYGRLLREVGDAPERVRGRAMLEAAAADFRTLDMVRHAALADRALTAA